MTRTVSACGFGDFVYTFRWISTIRLFGKFFGIYGSRFARYVVAIKVLT